SMRAGSASDGDGAGIAGMKDGQGTVVDLRVPITN
ncbi:MAG: hypothetical protein RIT16_562, partial [Actinomycetota bacterium]